MIDTEDPSETETMAEGMDEDAEFETEVEDEDLFKDFYVETSTNIIYEVQMFDTFCLVRPASPNMYGRIKKLSHIDLARDFHEYGGSHDEMRDYLRAAGIDFIVE